MKLWRDFYECTQMELTPLPAPDQIEMPHSRTNRYYANSERIHRIHRGIDILYFCLLFLDTILEDDNRNEES